MQDSEREHIISWLRTHNSDLFRALDAGDIFALQRTRIPRMDDWNVDYVLWMDVWEYAIEKEAAWAMHDLAVRLPSDYLINVWNMACQMHSKPAVLSLVPKLKREEARDTMLIPLVSCGEEVCNKCLEVHAFLLSHLKNQPIDSSSHKCFLDDDFKAIRDLVSKSKQAKCFRIHQPKLLTSVKTAVLYADMLSTAKRLSLQLAVATVARLMWRRWLQRQLSPDSRFVKKVALRWQQRALQQHSPVELLL